MYFRLLSYEFIFLLTKLLIIINSIQCMNYFVNNIAKLPNLLINYFYPNKKEQSIQFTIDQINNLTPEQRISALRKLLKAQSIYSEQLQGKIEMQFANLIKAQLYKDFSFTTQIPPQFSVPRQKAHLYAQQKKLLCFCGQISISTEIIKCPVLVQVLFTQNFIDDSPKFYVRNPFIGSSKLRPAKPNIKFVQIVKHYNKQDPPNPFSYKAKTDGIEIFIQDSMKKQKLDVKKMLDYCVDLVKRQFPFVKQKQDIILVNQQQNRDAQTQKLYQSSKQLSQQLQTSFKSNKKEEKNDSSNNSKKQVKMQGIKHNKMSQNDFEGPQVIRRKQSQDLSQLPMIINSIQTLDITKKAIQSEIKHVNKQNQQINEKIANMQNQLNQIQEEGQYQKYFPTLSKQQLYQQELLDALTDVHAYNDCLIQVEKMMEKQYEHKKLSSQQQLDKITKVWAKLNQNAFYSKIQLDNILKAIKQQSHN